MSSGRECVVSPTSFVTAVKSLKLSEPRFPYLYSRGNDSGNFIGSVCLVHRLVFRITHIVT